MKKRTLLLATLTVFTLTFAGCGSPTNSSSTKIPNTASGSQMEAASPTGNQSASQTNSENNISEDEAKAIALSDAGITEDKLTNIRITKDSSVISQEEAAKIVLAKVEGATEQHLRIKLDTDDGQQIYEGEIHYDGMEYEFELNAKTGDVLEWSKEREDD